MPTTAQTDDIDTIRSQLPEYERRARALWNQGVIDGTLWFDGMRKLLAAYDAQQAEIERLREIESDFMALMDIG